MEEDQINIKPKTERNSKKMLKAIAWSQLIIIWRRINVNLETKEIGNDERIESKNMRIGNYSSVLKRKNQNKTTRQI